MAIALPLVLDGSGYQANMDVASSVSSTTSFIDSLAFEILREIFVCCLTHVRRPSRRVAPLLLCHVCSRWRKVAMSIPQLWSELCLSWLGEETDTSQFMDTFINARDLWFRCLGRHCPLSYTVNLPPDTTHFAKEQSLLFPLPPSLRKLDLEMEDDSQLVDYGHLQVDSLVLLETVRISIRSDAPFSLAVRDFPFAHTPRLLSLALDIDGDRYAARITPLPWTQLTCLILGREIPLDAWHKIIRSCTMLRLCSVELHIPFQPFNVGTVTNMTHAHLSDLMLLFPSDVYLEEALAGLSFPVLTSLRLACDESFAFDLTSESFLRMLRDTQLTSFTLRQGLTDDTELFEILKIIKTVTSFDLTCDIFYDDLCVLLLCKEDDDEILLPELKHLSLGIFDHLDGHHHIDSDDASWYFSSQPLLEAIRSRCWPICDTRLNEHAVARLQSVRLTIDEKHLTTRDELEEELAPLQAQGLAVYVCSNSLEEDWSSSSDMKDQWLAYLNY